MEITQLRSCAGATYSQDFIQNQGHASLASTALQNSFLFHIEFVTDVLLLYVLRVLFSQGFKWDQTREDSEALFTR